MTRKEFLKAVALAQSPNFRCNADLSVFYGCALDNKRRIVTLEQVAGTINYHCATFGGTYDHAELERQAEYARRYDLVPNEAN